MLLWKYARAQTQAAVRVPTECLGGNAGRSLVAFNYPRHDAALVTHLQGISGLLRRDCDEHIGRSPAEAGGAWNHHHGTRPSRWTKADLLADRERNRSRTSPHGNGPVGSRARTYRQSSAREANAKGLEEILGGSPPALGQLPFTPTLTSVVSANPRKNCEENQLQEFEEI